MREKINDFITKNQIHIFAWTFTFIVLALLIACNIYNKKLYDTEITALRKENESLELDLKDRDNQIYDLNLELKTTNKALAEISAELDNMVTPDEILHFDHVGTFTCTAYCCEKYSHVCGTGSGKTASGAPVTPNVSCAVGDLEMFPFGTILYIEGVGIRIVQDTGNFDGTKIDCAVDTHKHASNWEGQGKHEVYIISIPKGE